MIDKASSPSKTSEEAQPKLRTFLRRKDVERLTGLKCSSIYEKMQAGEFPKPINISKRLVVWLEEDIAAWQAACIADDSRPKAKPSPNKG